MRSSLWQAPHDPGLRDTSTWAIVAWWWEGGSQFQNAGREWGRVCVASIQGRMPRKSKCAGLGPCWWHWSCQWGHRTAKGLEHCDRCLRLADVWQKRTGGLPQWCTQKRHLGLHDSDSAYSLVGVWGCNVFDHHAQHSWPQLSCAGFPPPHGE